MNTDTTPFLVDAQWLQNHLEDPHTRVFDCTTHMIPQPVGASKIVSGKADYMKGHIKGAMHLDMVEDLSDPAGAYPYTMLKPAQFEKLAQRIGLHKDDHVIIYGRSAISTLTRAWLVFYVMGHSKVSLLDGGLKGWTAINAPLTTDPLVPTVSHYKVLNPRLHHIATMQDVQKTIQSEQTRLLNALSREQYEGTAGAHYGRPGHIPSSLHLAARGLIEPESGQFLPKEKLLEKTREAGLTPSDAVIHYCGGGIAASTTAFALALLGWKDWSLYDNSLLEWSTQPDTPMVTR